MTRWARIGRGLALALAVAGRSSGSARADDDSTFELATALKSALLVSHAPDAPELFPERDVAASLWRFRFSPELELGEHVSVAAAYEHRLRVAPQGTAVGLAVLPPEAPGAYRLTQLDWEVGSGSAYTWRHEIDRLAVTADLGRLDLTVGRQAVGWGRGVMFGAVDLFAPFSALEVDREWRRGIDAIRGEVTLSDTISADAIAALGSELESSVFVGRVRGYQGTVDVELIGGWRARDLMGGVTSSAAIGDAELHGELAVFRAPDPLPAGGQIGDRTAIKAVVGGSYRFAVGSGIPVFVEYHYSGFGVVHASDALALLADPEFRARFERGDTQILGRHAIAAVATYEVSTELTTGVRWIQGPRDGSGVVAPNATATLGDRLEITAVLNLPYGAPPTGMTLQSEYGTVALAGFIQLVATY